MGTLRTNVRDERMIGFGAAIAAGLVVFGLFAPASVAIEVPIAVVLGPAVWLFVALKLPPWREPVGRKRIAAIAMCLESAATIVGALILHAVV